MIKHFIQYAAWVLITLVSVQVYADDKIKISVDTGEQSVAAIGFTVDGRNSGGPGKSYTGKGPKNKEYKFGYRKDLLRGTDIPCGRATLSKDSHVTLVVKEDTCSHVVN